MDRGTAEWLITLAAALALWWIPSEQAVAWARGLRRPHTAPAPVATVTGSLDGSSVSVPITLPPA